jgi:hypothetical protein
LEAVRKLMYTSMAAIGNGRVWFTFIIFLPCALWCLMSANCYLGCCNLLICSLCLGLYAPVVMLDLLMCSQCCPA